MLIGIVGAPSSGKSTFFKASTLAEVEIASYPFTTIKPNHAVGYVRVECAAENYFKKTCQPSKGFCIDGNRFVPIDLMDVAGLVPGAHKGEGMGNQFLNDLNQANALIHVIDVSGSTNEKGEMVEKLSYDPAEFVKFLEEELDYWYLSLIQRSWDRFSKQVVMEKREIASSLAKQLGGMRVTEEMAKKIISKLELDANKPDKWNEDEMLSLARELRIASKPMMIAANKADVPGAEENVKRLKKEFPHIHIIPCSSESELALREAHKTNLIKYIPGDDNFQITNESGMNDKQKKALEFIRKVISEYGSTGVQECLNHAIFDLLGYKYIFPGGVSKLEDSQGRTLPDCFLLPGNATALDFAYAVHSDFGDHFIKAIDVKKKMPVGKDHILASGDVIEIMAGK